MFRRRSTIGAALGAALLAASVSATALAGSPDADVTFYAPDGSSGDTEALCGFYMMFEPVEGGESGYWEIRDSGGDLLEEGHYRVSSTEGDREPTTGWIELLDGDYELWWDDERVDGSRREMPFTISCDAPAPTPTPTPTPTTGPTGGVEPTQGTPVPTLPPTDGFGAAGVMRSDHAGLLVVLLLGAVSVTAVGLRRRFGYVDRH